MRLIDADRLKQRYAWWADAGLRKEQADMDEIVDARPTIDAVAVTRCKNCKWCEDMGMSGLYCNHPDNRNPLGCRPDDYCSDGEPMPAPAPAK